MFYCIPVPSGEKRFTYGQCRVHPAPSDSNNWAATDHPTVPDREPPSCQSQCTHIHGTEPSG